MITFRRNRLVRLALAAVAGLAMTFSSTNAMAASWQSLTQATPFAAGVNILLNDGTVMCQDAGTNNWWKLSPSATGSYVDGRWKQIASTPASYKPLYFASAVLADGRVIVLGGEYNNFSAVWTADGYIYNPDTNVWAHLPGPWAQIGDAQCVVLPDGTFMVAHPFDTQQAYLNPATLAWTLVGTGKTDRHDEEGWTLLPDGSLITVDAINAPASERYNPATQKWTFAGNTPQRLVDAASQEMGPSVLLPNGNVLAIGATGHNAVYNPATSLWTAAPDFPKNAAGAQLDVADGPCTLLPNGNVLCVASPGIFNAGAQYFEYTGAFVPTVNHPDATGQSSYFINMLMLPTGQVMVTQFDGNVQIYTPDGGPNPAWKPTISSVPNFLEGGSTYTLTGTQLNGLSQCNSYGDDSSNASNYPLVRLRSVITGKVAYCKTFGHSTMAVATGALPVSTHFTIPPSAVSGLNMLEVVTNGIVSDPVPVKVRATRGI